MVDIEDLTEVELDVLHKYYQKISDKAEQEGNIHKSHSIDATEMLEERKHAMRF